MGEVVVRRSARRRQTVSAYRDGDTTVVLLPARTTAAQEREWVARMVARLDRADRRRRRSGTDPELAARAEQLRARYLPDAPRPTSVRTVANQAARWGSTTPFDGSIRLSDRLAELPRWVRDYVLVHELAHLVHADHSAAFWQLVARYPRADRARGYLEGWDAASRGAGGAAGGPDGAGEDGQRALSGRTGGPGVEGGWSSPSGTGRWGSGPPGPFAAGAADDEPVWTSEDEDPAPAEWEEDPDFDPED